MAVASSVLFVAMELPDGKRSPYFRIRSGARRPELYVEQEGQRAHWHLSLHESGEWHMKAEGEERVVWRRPPELAPGFTRALGIVLPTGSATDRGDVPDKCRLVSHSGGQDATVISAFYEPTQVDLDSWPGRNAMGTTFVGRLRLASDAGYCCMVAHEAPLPSGSMTGNLTTPGQLEAMQAAEGQLGMTVVGDLSDGAIALLVLTQGRRPSRS